jgi:hypothetical protein
MRLPVPGETALVAAAIFAGTTHRLNIAFATCSDASSVHTSAATAVRTRVPSSYVKDTQTSTPLAAAACAISRSRNRCAPILKRFSLR